jgi:membrane protease YdiL (CAAX protease family)
MLKFDTLLLFFAAIPFLIYKIIIYHKLLLLPVEMLIIPLIVAPVAEEFFFRGTLLEVILRKHLLNSIVANLAVSTLFAVSHLAVGGSVVRLTVFFPSLVLGWHYIRHRNLIAVIAAHSFYNFTIL